MSYIAGYTEEETLIAGLVFKPMTRLDVPIWENWDAEKLYKKGDKVYDVVTGSSYVCIEDLDVAGVNVIDILHWQIIAQGNTVNAYETWLLNGNIGTIEEFILSLKGETGATGAEGYTPQKGIDYFDGIDGINGTNGIDGTNGTNGLDGEQGIQGVPGEVTLAQLNVVNDSLVAHKLNYATYLNKELNDTHIIRKLPNGVKDEIKNGEKVQRVTQRILEESDITGMFTTHTNLDWARFAKPTDYINYNTTFVHDGSIVIGNYSSGGFTDNTDSIGKFNTTTSTAAILIGFPKGTTLAQARALLTGTKITYQLATPVNIPLPTPMTPNTIEIARLSERVDTELPLKANIAQEAWITPTLLNSYGSYNTDFTVGYKKDGLGRVKLKGAVAFGVLGTVAFYLPLGYRPTQTLAYASYTGGTTNGRVTIDKNGMVLIVSYTTFLALDTIYFDTI